LLPLSGMYALLCNFFWSIWASMCGIMGKQKASVFPEPVGAMASRLAPLRMAGQHCICTGEGLVTPRFPQIIANLLGMNSDCRSETGAGQLMMFPLTSTPMSFRSSFSASLGGSSPSPPAQNVFMKAAALLKS